MGNPIQYCNTIIHHKYRNGLATIRGGLYNSLGTPRGVIHNRKIVMISPPPGIHQGGFLKTFHRHRNSDPVIRILGCICHVFRVFPILYWISWIRWIQLESVKHDCMLPIAFLCLPLTVGSLVQQWRLLTENLQVVSSNTGLFWVLLNEKSSLVLNTKCCCKFLDLWDLLAFSLMQNVYFDFWRRSFIWEVLKQP